MGDDNEEEPEPALVAEGELLGLDEPAAVALAEGEAAVGDDAVVESKPLGIDDLLPVHDVDTVGAVAGVELMQSAAVTLQAPSAGADVDTVGAVAGTELAPGNTNTRLTSKHISSTSPAATPVSLQAPMRLATRGEPAAPPLVELRVQQLPPSEAAGDAAVNCCCVQLCRAHTITGKGGGGDV